MKFIDDLDSNSILICSNNDKKKILRYISGKGELLKFRMMDLNGFLKKWLFDYNVETIYYVIKNYNLSYDNAEEMIKNLYYIDDICYDEEKLEKLVKLKRELIDNELLIFDSHFRKNIQNYTIYIYLGDYDNNYLSRILSSLNVRYLDIKYKLFDKKKILEFDDIYDEINYVANSICTLISNGVDIKNIKISGVSSEYKFNLKYIFNNYELDVDVYSRSLYSTVIGSYFINNLKESALDNIDMLRNNFNMDINENEVILNKIIDICNKYTWIDNLTCVKECLVHDLRKTYLDEPINNKRIEICDLKDLYNSEDTYVFLLGFNGENMPVIYKDDRYISDTLATILNMETSTLKNRKVRLLNLNIIRSIKNLTITFKHKSSFNEFFISNLNDELEYSVVPGALDMSVIRSIKQCKIDLCKYLDNFTKYGTKNRNLEKLYFNLDDTHYRTYDNKYKRVNKDKIATYLNNEVSLSYSKIDKYYACSFNYYISNILKLDIYEETFSAFLGSLIHYILSKIFTDNFDFDSVLNTYISSSNYVLSTKEKILLDNIKPEIIYIIDTIKKQKLLTCFKKEILEKEINIKLNGKIRINFVGIIDKMMIMEKDGTQYISIIDYKTGNINTNLDHINDGLTLQLPIYAYLVLKSNLFNNPIISGMYYQKILHGKQRTNTIDGYEKEKYNNLKLIGLSTNDEEILSMFDSTYANSDLIKGMKKTSNGFSNFCKTFSVKEMEKILNIAEEKIVDAANNISEGIFKINPKQLNFENISCKYCKYNDLCYMTQSDIEVIEEGD